MTSPTAAEALAKAETAFLLDLYLAMREQEKTDD